MWSRLVTKLALLLLGSRISSEDKAKITARLLNKINALPIQNIVSFDMDGTLSISGKKLDMDQAINFREGVVVLKDSFARKVLNDQITYEAIKMGVHNGLTPEMIMFSKAMLYVIQEENKLIDRIVGEFA